MKEKFNLIIIGGGAAGLFAAGMAAQNGLSTAIIERSEKLGKKLYITGKGRCNVTNNCSVEDFLKNVHTNNKFLYSAAEGFTPDDTMDFFENRMGVPLKTERGNRVFPVSDKAGDIVDALVKNAKHRGVTIIKDYAEHLLIENNKITGVRLKSEKEYFADYVLVATGGKSYPTTGSDGNGYNLAREAGHTITKLRPALIPVICRERCCVDMMGLSLKNVTLKLFKKGKKKPLFNEIGEMLFTHFGVSGPLVLSASSYMDGNPEDYTISIDLKPGLTPEKLDARLLRDFTENQNKIIGNTLGLLLPRAMIMPMLNKAGISPDEKVNNITKAMRETLVEKVKNFTLTPCGFRPIEEAIITSGGVAVKEINPKTMESKICENLYFAGEIIDVDGYTGGFNLQIAFCTANSAVKGMLEKSSL